MIEMYESPQLSGLDKFICTDCVVDEALMDLVKDNLSAKTCSYCDEISAYSAEREHLFWTIVNT